MEGWKRLALFLGVTGGIVLTLWVSFTPLVVVSEVRPSQEQDRLIHGGYFPSEEDRRLAALSPEEYVREITNGKVREAPGERWHAVLVALRDGRGVDAWRRKELIRGRPELFFHVTEEPVREIPTLATGYRFTKAFVRVPATPAPVLLRLYLQVVSLDDFQLGSGWVSVVEPPSRLLYPARRLAPWVMVIGIALYLLLPGIRRGPRTTRHSRKQLVLSDLVAVTMMGFFFALPLLIPGGFQPALRYWPITAVFWVMAALFALVLPWTARHAGWAVDVGEDTLTITTSGGQESIPLSRIVGRRPAQLRSPRWLRRLLWVGALLNPGPGTVGRAAVLGGILATGDELELDDGSVRYIWAGNAMGGSSLENGDLLAKTLETLPAGKTGTAVIQTFGMPLSAKHPAANAS